MTLETAEPTPNDVALVQQVLQMWQQANQAEAIELLQPKLAEGEPWVDGFVAWLRMQQGIPGFEMAIPHALRAAQNGFPWVAFHLFNNIIGNIPNAPQLMAPALELARASMPWTSGIDPVGQGWNLIAQGRPEDGLRLIMLRLPVPFFPNDWAAVASNAQARLAELQSTAAEARSQKEQIEQAAAEAQEAMRKSTDEIKTSAGQAGLLITTIVSDGATSLYKAAAERSKKESQSSWTWGLWVLGAAAVVAVLPLLVHYLGYGPRYDTSALVGAHVASTVALASFAGVLLARARSRDISTQRNYDLETAMGTMVSYSNQIIDPAERQKFLMLMGQLVLQAHLSSGQSHSSDESLAGLLALANLIKPGSPAS
jgi:hypothetical protein